MVTREAKTMVLVIETVKASIALSTNHRELMNPKTVTFISLERKTISPRVGVARNI